MLSNVSDWNFECNELNELRYATIRTIEEYCYHPGCRCVKCNQRTPCQLYFIHDAINKLGVDTKHWDDLRNWAMNYMFANPRS